MLKIAKDSETEAFELSFLCAGKLVGFLAEIQTVQTWRGK